MILIYTGSGNPHPGPGAGMAGTWMHVTLDELKTGQEALIEAIIGDGPLAQRLMALGLLEGSAVTVTRRALGGDPIEVQVMGYALSLRREEARRIQVSGSR